MRQVASYIDWYLFARADEHRAERMLHEAYELAVGYVMRGGPLPLPVEAEIEGPKPTPHKPASREVAQAELAKMAALLRKTEPTVDQAAAESEQRENV